MVKTNVSSSTRIRSKARTVVTPRSHTELIIAVKETLKTVKDIKSQVNTLQSICQKQAKIQNNFNS